VNLDQIRAEWEAQNEAHLTAHGAWRCCSACILADARIPALLAEIDRLNARIDKAHDDLTRTHDDDPDEFVNLESTVEYVVRSYRALEKDFNELWELTGGLPLPAAEGIAVGDKPNPSIPVGDTGKDGEPNG
jgi:hypothetical protein